MYPKTSSLLFSLKQSLWRHYNDVMMGAMASQITSRTIVFFFSTVYSSADQRKHQSFTSLAFVRGIHRGPVNSLHKWPVTWKMFPFDDVIMKNVTFTPLQCESYIKVGPWGFPRKVWRCDKQKHFIPSNFRYKTHLIQTLNCFSSRLAVVFAQTNDARC